MDEEITTELVRELIDYAQETGVFTWRSRERRWFKTDSSFKTWNTRFAGKITGYLRRDARGYPNVNIKILGRLWLAHRLAFVWMGEELPDQIDHINRDSTNNKWENLCASSQEENMKNKSMHCNNTSGYTGVHWVEASRKWQARVYISGKRKSLGYFTGLEIAAESVRIFKELNGYSEGHGKEIADYVDNAGLYT